MSAQDKTNEQLNAILDGLEKNAADDLFQQFYLLNPLEFARLIHSLSLPDATKASLLALKVGLPTPYTGVDLSPLIEKAVQNMWARLAEQNK